MSDNGDRSGGDDGGYRGNDDDGDKGGGDSSGGRNTDGGVERRR